jgi:Xaa-Pro aminopeptidase
MEASGYKMQHLSGNGVGLKIHERPSLNPDNEDEFKNGMTFTIEPGVYLSEFGTRSEDTILLEGRPKVLTRV